MPAAADERVARSVALEQAYVHDVYEQFYDNPRSKPWPRVQQFVRDLEPGSVICDVGCGNGKYLNINPAVFNMGGDRSLRLTETAREKDNEVLVLDNLALPYRDESLDAVLSIAVVHHLATTERRICALRELARVLRIGGRLIISVWAMEQSHRKFESQDVLVPWHRPKHLSTPSLELTSTTNTSEDDCMPPYHAYTQTSDSDSTKSIKRGLAKRKGKSRRKSGRSIDPGRNSSPSSSSLSSPINETCYSFVRRAIQKLAGGRRVGVHRPWFLDSWTTCSKETSRGRHVRTDCDCCDCTENVQDIPIELRRIDDDEIPQKRRQTFPNVSNDLSVNLKSKSMTNIKTNEIDVNLIKSPSFERVSIVISDSSSTNVITKIPNGNNNLGILGKPKLVKQKKSICEDDEEEALDQPTDMKLTDLTDAFSSRIGRRGVLKQRSLNEELMSTDRLKEKERVRRNIQKQASLNEDLIYNQRHTHTFDAFKDSIFSVSTSKRFQSIKTGFTNKLKNSSTIEKVTKNGFVRMFQNWKSSDLVSPTIPEDEPLTATIIGDVERTENVSERRSSKEDGSDSSKDSSLQSDTSVDSEDSFASVIFVPKSGPMSPAPLSPGPISPRLRQQTPNCTPRIKQSSCPTSPRIKQMPLTLHPLTKQLSNPPSSSSTNNADKSESGRDQTSNINVNNTKTKVNHSNGVKLAQKYQVPQIPKFRRNDSNSTNTNNNNNTNKIVVSPPAPVEESRGDRLKKIKELLMAQKSAGFGNRSKSGYPIVRHSSVANGKVEAVAKPLPKLLSLELFNPETDDKDSDSSCVSSPDSVESVVSASNNKFRFPPPVAPPSSKKLLGAAQTSAKNKRLQSIIQRTYNSGDTTPLLGGARVDDDYCHLHLTDFADKLSEKLLKEIDLLHDKSKLSSIENLDDPYIHRLSEELDDLSKLSAEIQKQNEYLAKLSVSDRLFNFKCLKCRREDCCCKCQTRIRTTTGSSVKKVTVDEGETSCSSSSGGRSEEIEGKLSISRNSIRMGASTDSGDSERGSSTNSMSLNFGQSTESEGLSGSTASLASCPEWKTIRSKSDLPTALVKDTSSASLESQVSSKRREKSSMYSDASQDSLPSDNVGGEITYHRYYHVFREGELDQLIDKYVENLHIISSYYDHASWCIVAEKVQVWTI